ncbi:hypothetical protein [Desulfopila sp. IMCC35008]|uniref:hypothetical protein n=1 Tax=Desulfopila sp. IMCC35008 TaxID=2653858 RepID=UPI0013D4C8BF|nr:hypothetical protein [Desulfopila sp. IMCC35008]
MTQQATGAPPPSSQTAPLQLVKPPGQTADTTTPATLHDIHPPVDLPEPVPYILYGSIVLALLVALGLLLFWLQKKRTKPAPVIPPGILARSELMEARSLITDSTTLNYMSRVSDILRHYIEARFNLNPTRQTTREFFNSRAITEQESPLTPYRGELKQCLESCDLAKYAHRGAQVSQLQQMEETILGFINTTSAETAEKEGM